MKIKEMSLEERREYQRNKQKEWRLKNPEKNKESREKYKKSDKGVIANNKYNRKYNSKRDKNKRRIYGRDYYAKYPEKFKSKQTKEYFKNYMIEYIKNRENHKKFLIRQRDYYYSKKKIIKEVIYCQICGSTLNLEMHHKNYDNSKDDLMLLCRKCHRFLHRKNNLNKITGGKI